jgi:hypothetical protein
MNTQVTVDITLSIVIAAWTNVESLMACLDSISKQADNINVEVLVVSNYDTRKAETAFESVPGIVFFGLPTMTTVPHLRTYGITHSRGTYVSITEDFALFSRNWCSAVVGAHENGHQIVGGVIDHATGTSLIDWAVYLIEYGRFGSPVTSGFVNAISGLNASYSRDLLESCSEEWADGFEGWGVHRRLVPRGIKLYIEQTAQIIHSGTYSLGRSMESFFHHGRSLAGSRFDRRDYANRLLFAIGSMILPVVMTARVIKQALHKQPGVSILFKSLPLIGMLTIAWSAGEWAGYVGGPGKSPAHWLQK